MTRLFLLTLILYSGYFIRAQQVSIITGEEFETPRTVWMHEPIGSDSTGIYFRRNANDLPNKYIIHKVDLKTLKTVFSFKFEFDHELYKRSEAGIIGNYVLNGKILLFTRVSRKTGITLWMHEYSAASGKELGDPVMVDELITLGYETLGFRIVFSPDSKKMLVVTERKVELKKQQVKAKLYDCTLNYKKIWEKEPITEFRNSTVSTREYLVTNDGSLYYLFEYIRPKSEDDEETGIGMIPAHNAVNKTYAIPFEGRTCFYIGLTLLEEKLYCYGNFYKGEQKNRDNAEDIGVFLIAINPIDLAIVSESFEYFDDELKRKLNYSSRESMDDLAANKRFTPYAIIAINGCIHVVQQHKFTLVSRNYYEEREQEILVFKYTKNNTLDWMRIIPRDAMSLTTMIPRNETTGLVYIAGKNLYFLYYDHPSNLEKYPDVKDYSPRKHKVAMSVKHSVLVLASIDSEGKIKRQIITRERDVMLTGYNPENLFIKTKTAAVVMGLSYKTLRSYDMVKVQEETR